MLRKLLFVMPLALAATSANAANVLVNGGFEDGSLAPWTIEGAPFLTTAEAHSGAYSVSALGHESIRQDFAAVATADITEVSFWVKRLGGIFDAYTFFYDDATNATFFASSSGNDWIFVDATANLAVGKNLTGFRIYGTSPGPAYLDDFRIDEAAVPEPAAWALMLLGFGAAGAVMRSTRRSQRLAAG